MSAVQNLTSGAGAEAPAVGVDSAGNAVIAFRRNKPDGVWMQVRRRSATGALAPTADISTSPTNLLFEPRVAVSPAAGAVVGWQQLVEGKAIIHAAHRAPGGAWTQPQPITPLGTPAYLPRLDVDDDGNAVFAWHVGDEVRSRRRAADGALSPIDDLTAAPAMIDGLDLAVEAGGSAVVGWTALVDGKQGMHARRRTPTGELSVPQVLSD